MCVGCGEREFPGSEGRVHTGSSAPCEGAVMAVCSHGAVLQSPSGSITFEGKVDAVSGCIWSAACRMAASQKDSALGQRIGQCMGLSH